MIFVCENCDGNMVYSPEKKTMFCPYCEGEGTHKKKASADTEMTICPNCGGEIPVEEHDATKQCPYCDSHIILDQRVEGKYLPKFLIPFQMGKETCKKSIREKFQKYTFAPTDFLSDVKLNGMQGYYVPFWFYNYNTKCHMNAEGTKTRSWTAGNMRYTETSFYNVERNMDINFEQMPADASVKMPDDVMDLMAPYDYSGLVSFEPEYLSGFAAEKYNMSAESLEKRVLTKMEESADNLLRSSADGYGRVEVKSIRVTPVRKEQEYGMLPVWKYDYSYKGKTYPFYVNGQNGKIVGEVPLSKAKLWAYTVTLWASLTIIMACIVGIIFG